MAHWLNGHLKAVGVETKLVDLGKHIMDGEELPLPPAILGRIGNDPKKKTVIVYGHFDVQPVSERSGSLLSWWGWTLLDIVTVVVRLMAGCIQPRNRYHCVWSIMRAVI